MNTTFVLVVPDIVNHEQDVADRQYRTRKRALRCRASIRQRDHEQFESHQQKGNQPEDPECIQYPQVGTVRPQPGLQAASCVVVRSVPNEDMIHAPDDNRTP